MSTRGLAVSNRCVEWRVTKTFCCPRGRNHSPYCLNFGSQRSGRLPPPTRRRRHPPHQGRHLPHPSVGVGNLSTRGLAVSNRCVEWRVTKTFCRPRGRNHSPYCLNFGSQRSGRLPPYEAGRHPPHQGRHLPHPSVGVGNLSTRSLTVSNRCVEWRVTKTFCRPRGRNHSPYCLNFGSQRSGRLPPPTRRADTHRSRNPTVNDYSWLLCV